MEMARLGRPVLLRGRSVGGAAANMRLYTATMRAAGFAEGHVEQALDQVWMWYEAHVADTDAQALTEFLPQFPQASQYMAGMRERWHPKHQVLPKLPPPLPRWRRHPRPAAARAWP